MKQKIYTGLFAFLLLLMLCSVAVNDVHAQSKDKDKRSKPNDKAKKLLDEGNKLFARKDFRTAINKYAEAIVISPDYAAAHYWKGYAHYYLNEFTEAGEDLDTAFEQGYKPLEIYKVRWVVNFQKENFDAALSDVENGLLMDKNNTDFITGRSEILVRKGRYKEAIEALQNSIKLNPNNGDLYYFLALSQGKTGAVEQQAVNAAEAISKATKFTGESYVLVGDSLVARKKPTEAIDAYTRALNVKPAMSEEFFINFTQLYRSENQLKNAIDMARLGLKSYPKSSPLLVGLTWFYSLADRFGEAVGAGQEAIRNAPDSAAAHTNLCRAYDDVQKYPQAIIECNNALKITPNDGETFFYLARA
ncbi:MAG: tetratricopeptide repeat protein, partial [Acidobacteriota bacterium]|nr:tetratricopeptide repeat protein [Acidobacteriota bacterium]